MLIKKVPFFIKACTLKNSFCKVLRLLDGFFENAHITSFVTVKSSFTFWQINFFVSVILRIEYVEKSSSALSIVMSSAKE